MCTLPDLMTLYQSRFEVSDPQKLRKYMSGLSGNYNRVLERQYMHLEKYPGGICLNRPKFCILRITHVKKIFSNL
jgi:hypothetical protein